MDAVFIGLSVSIFASLIVHAYLRFVRNDKLFIKCEHCATVTTSSCSYEKQRGIDHRVCKHCGKVTRIFIVG